MQKVHDALPTLGGVKLQAGLLVQGRRNARCRCLPLISAIHCRPIPVHGAAPEWRWVQQQAALQAQARHP